MSGFRPVDYERKYEELSIKDKNNPKSLVNMLPSWLGQLIQAIPEQVLQMNEDELERKIGNISATTYRLRISFWEEYSRAIRMNKKTMNMSNIYGGLSDGASFQRDLTANSFRLAFLLKSPVEFNVALEEICLMGMNELRKIMIQPIVDDEGKVDSKLAQVKLKIWQDAMDRRRGHVLKQIDVKSQNLHLHSHRTVEEAPPLSAEEVEYQLKELSPPNHEQDIVRSVISAQEVKDAEEVF